MAGPRKHPVLKKFDRVIALVEKANAKDKKRYSIMTHGGRKITDVGVYDTQSKKYVLTDIRAFNAFDIVDEMIEFVK